MSATRSRLSSTLLVLALLLSGAHAQKPKVGPKKPAAPSGYTPLPVRTKLAPCWSVAFSPDGKTLAVGTYRRVQLYEVATGTKLQDWAVSSDAVRSLLYTPDGARLIAGTGVSGTSGAVVVLDSASGKVLQTFKVHDDAIEGLALLGDQILSASDDEKVGITDVATGKKLGLLSEHVGRCLAVAAPRRFTAQDGGRIFATGGSDKMLKIWDAEKRRTVINFDQCQSPVWCLVALPQPGRFVAGSGDGAVRVFGVRTDADPNQLADAETEPGAEKKPAPKKPSGDQPVPRTGFVAQTFGGAHEGGVFALAAAPNGTWVASGGADNRVIVWNLGRNQAERTFTDAKADIWGLAISPNSQFLAAASRDGRVRLYDLFDGKLARELPLAAGAK